MYDYYLSLINCNNLYLDDFLNCPSMIRLKNIGYFCGMDYASKEIYNFSEYISRFDHSFTVANLIYYLSKDKEQAYAGLIHDIGVPCFCHVVDYMNGDYLNQESTEEYTSKIIYNDKKLMSAFKKNNLNISNIVDFKNYSLVDLDRPYLCADRIDGIILTAIGWTKNITKDEIYDIINDLTIYENENNILEIGFKSMDVATLVLKINELIDQETHSKYDNYMMNLLSVITKLLIDKEYIKYEDLYKYDESYLFDMISNISDNTIKEKYDIFKNIKLDDIPYVKLPSIKKRLISPLVNGKRIN